MRVRQTCILFVRAQEKVGGEPRWFSCACYTPLMSRSAVQVAVRCIGFLGHHPFNGTEQRRLLLMKATAWRGFRPACFQAMHLHFERLPMLPFPSNIAVRPDATPRFTETLAEHVGIKNAMACQNDNAVRQQIDKATLSPDALQNLLAHAFLQNSSLAIKQALLGHPACDLPTRQTALELAIKHNDLPLARQALQQGADPEKITARPQADGMRTLLTYARRKNKLYPPNASHAQETDLDRALRDALDDSAWEEARNLLRQTAPGKNVREAWRDAVQKKQLDVQRAILLLGYADQDHAFRLLLQEDAVPDKGVAEVMKEILYFSPKRKWPQNFNLQATFSGPNKKKIECRHLVEHRQSVQERRPQIKFEDAHFASKEAIEAHVSRDTEAKYDHLIAHATEARLFHNRDFGKTLVQQLAAMAAEGEASRLILLTSINHAMGLGLKRKEKDGKPPYVVELFDPNRTTSHVRIASDSLSTLETLTLENLIDGAALYKQYYPEPDGLSMMFVRPPPQEEQAMTGMAQGVVENRTLTSSIEDKEINATALWHMLTHGFAGDLRRLKGEIASRPETERIALLEAKDARNIPGLFIALQKGHADAIRAFGELLLMVPEEQRAKLLAAKDARNLPGLFIALKEGRADAIKAFGELLPLVPAEQRAALLAAKSAKGKSGLAAALEAGKLEALEQYVEIVKKTAPALSAQDRAALLKDIRQSHAVQIFGVWFNFSHYEALKKENPDFHLRFQEMENALLPPTPKEVGSITSGLSMALQQGRADAIEALVKLLNRVPPEQRAALLAAKDTRNIPGLYTALEDGYADTIKAFGKLLDLVPEEQRAPLVAAKYAGDPGLFIALQNGHADAIKAFGDLLRRVPEDQRVELLAAKDVNGAPGLYAALMTGNTAAIKAFGDLLHLVPPERRAELLSAKETDNPWLFRALQEGPADAINAFCDLLNQVPAEQRAELLAVTTHAMSGSPTP